MISRNVGRALSIQGAAGLGDAPCVPSVGGPPRGGVPQPICYLLFTYTYHVLLPASTATFCFVCSTCDAAMDLLSAHATRLAPEQARLAPTAPRCVATGAWDKWLADHDVAAVPPAVGSNFGVDGESSTGLDSMSQARYCIIGFRTSLQPKPKTNWAKTDHDHSAS